MARRARAPDAGGDRVSGLLPPAALRSRVGDLEARVKAELAEDHQPPMRDRPREYAALVTAITTEIPAPCIGDDRFTADRPRDLSLLDVADLHAVCTSCEIRVQCAAYAAAARPPIGFWAGQQYPRPKEVPPA